MATKKPLSSRSKAKPQPSQLQNLAARPQSFDDTIDEQLVDHSGVFRVTSQIAQAQTGHDEEPARRFPNESLVMAAQRDGFREDAPDEPVDDVVVVDEALRAERRQRLAAVAARARQNRINRAKR